MWFARLTTYGGQRGGRFGSGTARGETLAVSSGTVVAMPQPNSSGTGTPRPVAAALDWWGAQTGPARATALGGVAILAIVVLGVVALLSTSGNGDESPSGVTIRSNSGGLLQPTDTPGVVSRVTSGSRDAADEDDRPKPDPDPLSRLPLIRTLDALKQFGEPPDATFARLRIPSQGVNAPV